MQLPLHLEWLGDNREIRLQAQQRQIGLQRLEDKAHEETPGFDVAELLRFQHVVTACGEVA